MKMTMDFEVNKDHYEFNHGHKPRGTGNWAIRIKGPGSYDNPPNPIFWFNGPLNKAIQAAKIEARARFFGTEIVNLTIEP